MFLAMAQDDRLVGSGVRGFYDPLFAAGYRPELHLFRSGGHGFGLRGEPLPSAPPKQEARAQKLCGAGLGVPDEGRAGAARRPRVIRSCSGPGHPRCGLPAS